MNKNNSPRFSDEQVDRLAKTILRSVILTDEETDEIIDAPHVWRKLQNNIAREKSRRGQKRRIFFGWNWQTAAAAFGTAAIIFAVGARVLFFGEPQTEIAAAPIQEITAPLSMLSASPGVGDAGAKTLNSVSPVKIERSAPHIKSVDSDAAKRALKSAAIHPEFIARQSRKNNRTDAKAATDFIALSYLPASESGQIVSVNVPRSLMVALGVTTDTARNAELVKAEIVVGDDGAARAIRFLKN